MTDSKGKLIKEYPSKTAGQLDLSSNIWDAIHDGMYRVVQTHDQFNGLGVEVAGKPVLPRLIIIIRTMHFYRICACF